MNGKRGIGLRLPTILALVTGLAALGFAGGASAGTTGRIVIKRDGRQLFFAPKTVSVSTGSELTIKNRTNPQAVGPHTLSLVEKDVRPDSPQERRDCFKSGHICRRIIKWHGGQQVPTNPSDPGLPGWDTMGDLQNKGDSFFFDQQGQRFTQLVSAPPDTTLFFMCAVHPNMKGKILVTP